MTPKKTGFYIEKKITVTVVLMVFAFLWTSIFAFADSYRQNEEMKKTLDEYGIIPSKVLLLEQKVSSIKEDVTFIKNNLLRWKE